MAGTMLVSSRSNPCYSYSIVGFVVRMGKERFTIMGQQVTNLRLGNPGIGEGAHISISSIYFTYY
ncbi:MAG: hypothetical protein GWP03_03375 [Proteobacteria bacterium]|nr:hypothetical protein [Pseudomonadota bacterium]